MKSIMCALMLGMLLPLFAGRAAQAGEIDVLVNRLVQKGILTPAEAQIVVDETKIQVSKDLAQAKSLSVPEWTQRIKWGGDVRFRTQGDWGKTRGLSTPTTGTGTVTKEQRIRERVRGRFYMEGKVNNFTYGGVRFAGGATDPRSTNDTLDGYFDKKYVMFDQYYMRFEAPSDIIRSYGQYFSDLKLWAGKFNIPFQYSELVWDSDINPGGIAFQYVSPDIKTGILPDLNAYGNIGMFWLNEFQNVNTDSLLFGYQVGLKSDVFGPLGTEANLGVALYDFANIKNKAPTVTANTNTRTWQGDGLATTNFGQLRYEYLVFDLLLTLDNSKIMDWDFPHGFYADFIHNPCAPLGNGLLVGAYIGKKKLKVPGDWKARAEWRYIERDAIPDFMPDSDFYGFGTWASYTNALGAGNNGIPAAGGTNGKGINLACEYQLLKNTVLSLEYYWMKPIDSWDKHNPYNEFQFDIITKF